ncbi:MAG: hypothetical protein RQ982_12500 [Gammaproteobacteria bacterium]|nr:hypothetical protein [Gammaproteobacteria bacterium]
MKNEIQDLFDADYIGCTVDYANDLYGKVCSSVDYRFFFEQLLKQRDQDQQKILNKL